MRDSQVVQQFQSMAAHISHDQANLVRALSMMRARLDSIERLMLGSRIGLLKLAVLQLISPTLVAKMVTAVHTDEILKLNKERAIAEKQRGIVKASPTAIIRGA